LELFRKEALGIEHGTHNWESAIRITGKVMLDIGAIEEPYIQAMIDAVHEMGPYIVVAPRLALAHAAAREGVIKNDMVLVVFKEPVIFNSENDPVHLMIGLCALEAGSHLEQLTLLADLLEDENVLEKLHAANNIEELYKLVNKKI